jgi:hypothetical protein
MMNRFGLITTACALGLLAWGCGGDDSEFERFLGTWQYGSGNEVQRCPGEPDDSVDLRGDFIEFSEGTDAALVILGRGCIIRFDVSGATATARAGQTCETSFLDPDLGVVTITTSINNFNFTVSGLDATEASSGGLTYRASRIAETLQCTFMSSGSLRKVAK